MKIVRRSLAVVLAALLVAPAAQAQTHVIAKSALDAGRAGACQPGSGGSRCHPVVARSAAEVRQIAAAGRVCRSRTAQAAVSTLQGQDLRDLASQARQVNNDLAAGASTIVISTTTIIIVLLIVILIVLVAD